MIAAQSAAYGCGGAIDAATLRALTRQKVEEHARKAEMAYVRGARAPQPKRCATSPAEGRRAARARKRPRWRLGVRGARAPQTK